MSLPESLPDLLTIIIVLVAVPLTWSVALLLWRASRLDPTVRALRATATMATGTALIVTVFALVFANNDMDDPVLAFDQTRVVTRTSLLVLSTVPAVFWWRWYRGKGL